MSEIRRKVFISHHKDDIDEVNDFIDTFDHASLSPPSSFSFLCAQVIKKRKKG